MCSSLVHGVVGFADRNLVLGDDGVQFGASAFPADRSGEDPGDSV